MKKIISYFLLFIFICFILPAILTNPEKPTMANLTESDNTNENGQNANKDENNESNKTDNIEGSNYEYKNYGTIKLLHDKTNTVEEITLDDYLVNVVCAEMPASYNEEALKAQAIVARTYTVYKINHNKHERG